MAPVARSRRARLPSTCCRASLSSSRWRWPRSPCRRAACGGGCASPSLGVVVLLMLVNRLLLPTITGWSLGRALFGIAVVRRDGTPTARGGCCCGISPTCSTPVGGGMAVAAVGSRRRTFADMLRAHRSAARRTARAAREGAAMDRGGAAHRGDSVPGRRRRELLGRVPAGSGDRPDRAADRDAGAEDRRPDADVRPEDAARRFRRAPCRWPPTDIGPKLAAQQESVEKGHPVINEYWVTDSAIQSATPDRATMLLFMQGRRGAAPEVRYITASVRVKFVKGQDDQWRVDDLTVLTKPKAAGERKMSPAASFSPARDRCSSRTRAGTTAVGVAARHHGRRGADGGGDRAVHADAGLSRIA